MRKYSKRSSSEIRIAYGIELIAGLETFDATKELAQTLRPVNDELKALRDARSQKEHERATRRAALRAAEYHLDQGVRSFARAVEIADGGRRGSTYQAVFPGGMAPLIAPEGRRQVEPAAKFLERLRALKTPSLEATRAEWLPRLEAALQSFQDAVRAYDVVASELAQLFAQELLVRDEHELAVERLIGHVRAQFPRDSALREVIFPFVGARRSGEVEDEEGEADLLVGAAQ